MNKLLQKIRPERLRELILLLLISVVLIFFASVIERYLNARLFNRVSASVAIMALLAIAQTLVILTRNIDLSVGAVVGFTAYFVGYQLSQNQEITPLVAILMAIGVGALMGGFNGFLVAFCGIPSIIVTLGTMALYRTLLVEYSDAQTVLTVNLPQWLLDIPRVNILSFDGLNLRLMVGVMIAIVILFQLFLRYTSFGRKIYAVGSNPEAASNSGFPNRKIIFITFILCGALAGLSGFMYLARFGNITVVAGLGLELKSVAAAVVGGVNIFGGSGSIFGSVLGAILIDLLENSLIRWLQISEFWRDAMLGILILASVAADSVIMKRFRRYRLKKQTETKS
ncbi:MAG: ABC transporter permease [Fidelibacterota bacterium]|jgi:rhamnose transport system permease protein|tara:strand:- start:2426 stop:3445 length:1020 start_codon:yes stop_codon:yes gene_type:complete